MYNLAILSCGHVHTQGYCEQIQKRDDCRLEVVWDDMPQRGRDYASRFDADFSDDLAATVARKGIDGFIICAENTRHLPLLQAAAGAGKPIFCEKPFTTTVDEARQALAAIRRHDATVFMGYMQPFSARMQGAAELLAHGRLGKVTHARFRNAHHAAYGHWFDSPSHAWFTDPALAGGGAFMDMGTHAVHALRTLLGPVTKAWATIDNASGIYANVDDWGIAHLLFASGVMGTVEAAWVQTGGARGLEITGSEATLYELPGQGLVYAAPRQDPQPVPEGKARPVHIERLLASIRGELTREELQADLAAAADAVAIMQACYESSRLGTWVDVPTM